jgi:hypothetical protein
MSDVDDGRSAAPVEIFLAVDVMEIGPAAGLDQRESPMEVAVENRSIRIAIFGHGGAPILSPRRIPLSKFLRFLFVGRLHIIRD